MKVLVCHEAYQQRGGEDAVVAMEIRLLERNGHRVIRYDRHNDELRNQSVIGAIGSGLGTIWSARAFRDVKELIAQENPDVAHFHNTFPLISPSVYHACADAGVPVVQTLHNYRLLCPAASLMREGKVCEQCLGRRVAWAGIVHACYRGDRLATAAVAAMLMTHRAMGTWREKVDLYVALSAFARQKFIEGGVPSERIVVKPNFVEPDPGVKQMPGKYALYVGRLSEEKGLRVLLTAWSRLRNPIPLRIVGDGPLMEEIVQEVRALRLRGIEVIGRIAAEQVTKFMHEARFLVFPSVWYEGFPLSTTEAFACGLPVIASRLGAMEEIVEDGTTGLHFSAGDAADLAEKVQWAWEHLDEMQAMGRAARVEYEVKYTASVNARLLADIYKLAIKRFGQRVRDC